MKKVSKYKIARAYASAWLETAISDKCEDRVLDEVTEIQKSVINDVSWWQFLRQPVDSSIKLKFINDFTAKAKLSKISSETLSLIVQNNKIDFIDLILESFVKLYYAHKGIVEVYVDTVVDLTATQSAKLKKVLEEKLKAPVVIKYRINPDILGGLAIRFNSFLIDDTISSKLKRVENQMLDTPVGL